MKTKTTSKIFLGFLIFLLGITPLITYAAPDLLSDLERQIDQNRNAANQKKAEANTISDQISIMNSQIASTQVSLTSLNNSIKNTEKEITRLSGEIKLSEEKISLNKKNLKQLIQLLYEQEKVSSFELLASASSITDVMNAEDYNRAIEDKVNAAINETKNLKSQLDSQKKQQEDQKALLQTQKTEVENQIKLQETQRNVQNSLYQQAKNDQNVYQQNVINLQARADSVRRASGIGSGGYVNSGGDLIVRNNAPYYYSQRSGWGYIGNSSSSVYDYGCALTSVAMVATAYGHSWTPGDIAANPGFFNYDLIKWGVVGNAIGIGGNPYIGNKSQTDYYLSKGKLVIAYLYIGHYVVISGKSGSTYTVQDPYFGSGSGYSWSDVGKIVVY